MLGAAPITATAPFSEGGLTAAENSDLRGGPWPHPPVKALVSCNFLSEVNVIVPRCGSIDLVALYRPPLRWMQIKHRGPGRTLIKRTR